jgi:IclR family transcriptional regulator, KDG regulon repressor
MLLSRIIIFHKRNYISIGENNPVETVHKTIDILETFLKQPGEIGIAELSALSGVNISTAYRISSDLVKRGYLKQKQKRGKYYIGTKLLEFNPIIQSNIKIGPLAEPHLHTLCKQSGESVDLAILDNYQALIIGEAAMDRNFHITATIGERLPLHASSLGKIFLAYMKDEDRKYYYNQHKLLPRTNRTISDITKLELELEKVKQQGYSLDNEELDMGVWAVSAPIFDWDKNVAASLAIVAPSVRVKEEKLRQLVAMAQNSALEISRELGYKTSTEN